MRVQSNIDQILVVSNLDFGGDVTMGIFGKFNAGKNPQAKTQEETELKKLIHLAPTFGNLMYDHPGFDSLPIQQRMAALAVVVDEMRGAAIVCERVINYAMNSEYSLFLNNWSRMVTKRGYFSHISIEGEVDFGELPEKISLLERIAISLPHSADELKQRVVESFSEGLRSEYLREGSPVYGRINNALRMICGSVFDAVKRMDDVNARKDGLQAKAESLESAYNRVADELVKNLGESPRLNPLKELDPIISETKSRINNGMAELKAGIDALSKTFPNKEDAVFLEAVLYYRDVDTDSYVLIRAGLGRTA